MALTIPSLRRISADVDEVRAFGSGGVAVGACPHPVDAGLRPVRGGNVPGLPARGSVPLLGDAVSFLRVPVPSLGQPVALVGSGAQPFDAPVAFVRRPLPVVRHHIPLVGKSVTLIGDPVPLVRNPIALVRDPVAVICSPVSLVSDLVVGHHNSLPVATLLGDHRLILAHKVLGEHRTRAGTPIRTRGGARRRPSALRRFPPHLALFDHVLR